MHGTLKTLLGVAAIGLATQAAAQVTFYDGDGYRGRAFTVDRTTPNLDPLGFNDRAKSAVVSGGYWEVCTDAYFHGRCTVLQPGNYYTLGALGFDRLISSVRPAGRAAYASAPPPPPAPEPVYEYRQRPNEQLFQAPVTWVHAVVGPPQQQCWVERQQYTDNSAKVGGAVLGAVLGGVLGHQIGSGGGRDVATAGGAVAGAAIGANVAGRGNTYGQDVQRCETYANQGPPDYWDVTYTFRGVTHRVQMSAPPGPTVTVNGNGEPRGWSTAALGDKQAALGAACFLRVALPASGRARTNPPEFFGRAAFLRQIGLREMLSGANSLTPGQSAETIDL